jgi:hypothetical protein
MPDFFSGQKIVNGKMNSSFSWESAFYSFVKGFQTKTGSLLEGKTTHMEMEGHTLTCWHHCLFVDLLNHFFLLLLLMLL